MLFARLRNKQKIAVAVVIFVCILILAFFAGYSLIGGKGKGLKNQGQPAESDVEVKILRTQQEITASYKDYMERVIERLQKAKNKEELVSISENMFFDVYVPTDLRDMHVQKLLEANKLLEDQNLGAEELREKLISIVNELLAQNQKLIYPVR